jgi:fucose permease
VLKDNVSAAMRATYAAFIASGFAFASWAARIPQVKSHLHLDASQLGLLLLCIAAGSVLGLPVSGSLVNRWGSSRTVAGSAVLLAVALVVIAVGYHIGTPVLVVGLFLLGLSNGAWDVAMNVQAAQVERRLGRAIMSRFHAGWSVGTVAGAVVGAGAVAVRLPVPVHMALVAVLLAIVVPLCVRPFLTDHHGEPEADPDAEAGRTGRVRLRSRDAWREPRTLLVGVFVLAYAFGEGTGNDWISVAVIDGHHTEAVVGTLCFAVFLAAMTTGRWLGPALLDRYGRVNTVRALAVSGVAGLLMFVLGPTPLAFTGALLWGIGISLGFPIGMSAGADEAWAAPARVSVVASIGYCAFLGGPPLVGFLGQEFGILHGVVAVLVLLAVATTIAGVVRPPASQQAMAGPPPPAG